VEPAVKGSIAELEVLKSGIEFGFDPFYDALIGDPLIGTTSIRKQRKGASIVQIVIIAAGASQLPVILST